MYVLIFLCVFFYLFSFIIDHQNTLFNNHLSKPFNCTNTCPIFLKERKEVLTCVIRTTSQATWLKNVKLFTPRRLKKNTNLKHNVHITVTKFSVLEIKLQCMMTKSCAMFHALTCNT